MLILIVGVTVSVAGWIAFLGVAFRENVLWGLACMFIPLLSLVFAFTHWQDARKGYLVHVVGALAIYVGAEYYPNSVLQLVALG
jgi:hypothetical protein